MPATVRLVVDVGGTNIRLALAREDRLDQDTLSAFPCDRADGLAEVITTYLGGHGSGSWPEEVCVGIAGPVEGDRVRMTNRNWEVSIEGLRRELKVRRLAVINDFVAAAMAIPRLAASEWIVIGEPLDGVAGAPIAVLGPGTGLGMSALVPHADRWVPVATEGGHASLAPADEEELALLEILWREERPASLERVLCGPGLSALHTAMAELEGRVGATPDASGITAEALADPGGFCGRVLARFCAMLGTAAGNLALTYGARGGVYLAGGILPRMAEFLEASPFRERFEHQEGRYRDYVAAIPTRLVIAEHPGLAGALAYLLQH
jgi:glucokinase